MEHRIRDLLPLVTKTTMGFGNIPGLPHAEIEMGAQEALVHTASRFDPAKGEFQAYAAIPIRDRIPCLTKKITGAIDKAPARKPINRFPDAAQLLAPPPTPRP